MWWKCYLVAAWWRLLELANRLVFFIFSVFIFFGFVLGSFDEVKIMFSLGGYSQPKTVFDELSVVVSQPALSPRRLSVFNTITDTISAELNFVSSILCVRMNRKR